MARRRRILIKKLKPNQSPLLSTRWVLATYDPNDFTVEVKSYHHNHYDAITVASLMIKEG